MKNIAILTNTLRSGGAEKQSVLLLKALKEDYIVYFIIFHGGRTEEKMLNSVKEGNFNIIKLKGTFFYKILTLYKILYSNNITHLFTFLTKSNILGAIIGKIAGVERIYGSIRNTKLPEWKFILEKFIANNISINTIFNNYSGEILFKKKGLNNSIVIPNGYDTMNSSFNKKIHNIKKIITVGTFVKQKDYKTALQSIAELKKLTNKFSYHIVGYGILESQIRNWVSEQGLNNNVQIIINPNNIPELLKEADIYLSTSLWEGTSNSIMEAMNAYLPIVATNVGDNNKLIVEGKNGFLHDVGDFKGITKSLELLLNDYTLRIKCGTESNCILRNNYSLKKFKESYLELINGK